MRRFWLIESPLDQPRSISLVWRVLTLGFKLVNRRRYVGAELAQPTHLIDIGRGIDPGAVRALAAKQLANLVEADS
jgi:hypothetical protein